MHHDVASSSSLGENDKSKPEKSSLVSDLLSTLNLDDYYDDVEQQRSKSRTKISDQSYSSDEAPNSASFDPSVLFDSDDYGDSSSASSLISELLNKKKDPTSGNKNPFLDKVKGKLNNLIPKTISSESESSRSMLLLMLSLFVVVSRCLNYFSL